MKTTKKINWIFKEVEITSKMKEFQTLQNFEKIEILEKEYWNIEKIKWNETQTFLNENWEEEQKEVEILKTETEILEELFLLKEKQERLKNLKIETADKIYKKYSKEKQTMLLYSTLFLFMWKMLEDTEIKAKFSKKELELFWNSKNVFLDMEKFIWEYKKETLKIN